MKRIIKRTISALLMAIMLLSMTPLMGCGESGGGTNENKVTKGEWLAAIVDAFGIESYQSVKPHVDGVDSSNPFFDAVQAAYEWNIIDDSQLDLNTYVDKGYAATTLVNAVGFYNTKEMAKEDITQYAVDHGYVTFPYRGRTDTKRYISREEASDSVKASFYIWADHDFGESKETYSLAAGVIDLSKEETANYAVLSNRETLLPNGTATQLQVGDTYIVPDVNGAPSLRTVESVEETEDGVVIHNADETPGIDTTIENLQASGTVQANLLGGRIVDGAGNVISTGLNDNSSSTNSLSAKLFSSQMLQSETDDVHSDTEYSTLATQLATPQAAKLEFEVDGLKISGTVKQNSVEFSVSGDIVKNSEKGTKITLEKSYEIKDVNFSYDYNIEWFKLKSAYAKLSYKTVDKSGVKFSWKKEGLFAPGYSNGNGHFLSNFTRAVLKDSQAKGAKTIKICSIPIADGGVASLNLDVKIKLSVSGAIELVVTTDCTRGVEYKNGNVRFIKDEYKDTDLAVKGKVELTLYLGLSCRAIGVNIIGLGIEGGIGVAVSVTAHLVDSENHLLEELSLDDANQEVFEEATSDIGQLSYSVDGVGQVTAKLELCFDVTTYGILKFTIDTDSVIGGMVPGGEIIIFGKDNAKIDALSAHWEDGVNVGKCTRKYDSDKANEANEDSDITEEQSGGGNEDSTTFVDPESPDFETGNGEAIGDVGSGLDIDTYFVSIAVGENWKLGVDQLPSGYEMSSIRYASDNAAVAKVDSNGRITGMASGSATITVSTSDGKYKIICSVSVLDPNENASIQLTDIPTGGNQI